RDRNVTGVQTCALPILVRSVGAKRVDGQFRVFAKGGREDTGLEAIEWIKDGVRRGAGEIVLNSVDTDGVKGGFDLEMLAAVCDEIGRASGRGRGEGRAR